MELLIFVLVRFATDNYCCCMEPRVIYRKRVLARPQQQDPGRHSTGDVSSPVTTALIVYKNQQGTHKRENE